MTEETNSKTGTLRSALKSVHFYGELVLDFLLDLEESLRSMFPKMSNKNLVSFPFESVT